MNEDNDSIRAAMNAVIDNTVLTAKPIFSFQKKKITLKWPDTDYPFGHMLRTWGSLTTDFESDEDVAWYIQTAYVRGEISDSEAQEIWSQYERDVRVRR